MAKGSAKARKTMARLIAVQMLYRQEFEPITTAQLLKEFKANGPMLDEGEWVDPDLDLVNQIISGIGTHSGIIDEMLKARITPEQQSEPLIAAILRAGIFELVYNIGTPTPIVISDYLSVSAAFFDNRETALVNGVLDAVAKLARPA